MNARLNKIIKKGKYRCTVRYYLFSKMALCTIIPVNEDLK